MKTIVLLIAVVSFALCGVAAMAAYDWHLISPRSAAGGWVNTTISRDGGAYYGQLAGAFFLDVASAPVPHPATITTYCIDFTNVANDDWYIRILGGKPAPASGVPAMTDAAWKDLAWLNQTYWTDSLTSATKSAGFQLAVWDCLYDSGTANAYDVTQGAFKAKDSAAAEAQMYLNALKTANGDFTANTVFYQDDQNQMGKNVPEIPTALLAPLGLSVLGLIRRRFAK